RRWMRTIPLYVLWTIVLLIVDPPGSRILYVEYLTFTQNLFGPMNAWFAVSWSLSIEEWFYLLFSACLLGTALLAPRRMALITFALFLIGPLVLRIAYGSELSDWDGGMRKVVVYRLDAIAYGCLFAYLVRSRMF